MGTRILKLGSILFALSFTTFLFQNSTSIVEGQNIDGVIGGWDIMVMAGQSNAVGVAPATRAVEDAELALGADESHIYQYTRSCFGHQDRETIPAKEPLDFQGCELIQNWSKQNTRSSIVAFARRYIANGYLKQGRKVLIIPAAKSGSAITAWSTENSESNYFSDMQSRLVELLKNPNNRLVAFHWQQGETDMLRYYDDKRLVSDADHSPSAYKIALTKIIAKIKSLPSGDHAAILIGEAAKELPYGGLREHIAMMSKVAEETPCAAFISSENLLAHNDLVSVSDHTHFTGKGQVEMAKRRIEKFSQLPSSCQGKTTINDAYDFMVMDVCTDANGITISGSPFNCPKHRNVMATELSKIPYHPNQIGVAGKSISRRYMFPIKDFGTDQNGIKYPLIIGWTQHTENPFFSNPNDNLSFMTIMDGYASDAGSTGGQYLSINLGADYVKEPNKYEGLGRFSRSWLFFDIELASLKSPMLLTAQSAQSELDQYLRYTTSSEQLMAVDRADFDGLIHPDSKKLKSYLSLQVRKRFSFGSEMRVTAKQVDTIIENKYSSTNSAGTSPGDARAMERVYFTRELGETRWEAWKRDINSPFDQLLNSKSAAKKREFCSRPAQMMPEYSTKKSITPNMVAGVVYPVDTTVTGKLPDGTVVTREIKTWAQDMSYDDGSGVKKHTWYLTACADWSDINTEITDSDMIRPLKVMNGLSLFDFAIQLFKK